MTTDACWTRSIKGPVDADGIFILRNFTLQDDQETVLVNEKRIRQMNVSLEVPIRVLLRQERLAKVVKKEERYYQPRHSTDSGSADPPLAVMEEKPIVLNLNSESVQKQQLSSAFLSTTMEATHVKCNNCGGYHYTYCCPQRETYKRDIITEKGGVYVPPSKKNNAEKQTYSLKLDPVPHFWTRESLQKLVDTLCEELRIMLKNQQNGGDDKQVSVPIDPNKLNWREKARIEKEKKEAMLRANTAPVEQAQNQAGPQTPAEDLNAEKDTKPEPEPEDEQIASIRTALAGLKLERASFPLNRVDGRRQGYAYINLGTKEAQRLFKARWDGARIASEQIIMHVLLPEEYAPTRK